MNLREEIDELRKKRKFSRKKMLALLEHPPENPRDRLFQEALEELGEWEALSKRAFVLARTGSPMELVRKEYPGIEDVHEWRKLHPSEFTRFPILGQKPGYGGSNKKAKTEKLAEEARARAAAPEKIGVEKVDINDPRFGESNKFVTKEEKDQALKDLEDLLDGKELFSFPGPIADPRIALALAKGSIRYLEAAARAVARTVRDEWLAREGNAREV